MSFGGAVSSMITSLKNNSRKKDKSHFNRQGMAIKTHNTHLNELLKIKATPEQLAEIREKAKVENRKSMIKSVILLIAILALFYFGFGFLFK